MPQTGTRNDPLSNWQFQVVLGNQEVAHFTQCAGLGVDISVIKYREAGSRQIVRKLPGQVDYSPVTLWYGLTSSQEVFQWMMSGVEGRPNRQNISIVILDNPGNSAVVRYNLTECWVASIRCANLDALSSSVAIETITIVYESLQRAQ